MSRDMHCEFDKGFFMIEDDYTIIVHPDVLRTDSCLNKYNGQKILFHKLNTSDHIQDFYNTFATMFLARSGK